jgi:hypothetical protein
MKDERENPSASTLVGWKSFQKGGAASAEPHLKEVAKQVILMLRAVKAMSNPQAALAALQETPVNNLVPELASKQMDKLIEKPAPKLR